jgi:hypothetical protein
MMHHDKETQKVRVKNFLINFQLDAPSETAGVDIEKCVNDAYDFFGNRVVSDRDILDICFLMIIRIIEPLAREYIDSRKRAWAQHPEIKTLLELERKHFGYVDTPKPTLETESPKSSAGLGIITPDPMVKMLGPGCMRFASPFGIKGAARESANRVDLLAVVSDEEGTGHFRAFIRHCQANYDTICVWEVWNDTLRAALRRYGFQPALESDQFDELFRGWRWDRSELTN